MRTALTASLACLLLLGACAPRATTQVEAQLVGVLDSQLQIWAGIEDTSSPERVLELRQKVEVEFSHADTATLRLVDERCRVVDKPPHDACAIIHALYAERTS